MSNKTLIALSLMLATSVSLGGCARQETAPRMGKAQVREMAPRTLQDLPSGHPLSYYVTEFERLGYTIDGTEYLAEQAHYELTKGNNVEEVTLYHPVGQNAVSQIQVKQLGWFSTNWEENDLEAKKLKSELNQLPSGKKPDSYIPLFDKYGTVSEYKLTRDQAQITLDHNKRHYKIQMKIDPTTKVVTNINLEKGFLQLMG